MEHKHHHEDAVYDLYYGGPSKPVYNSDAKRLEVLTTVQTIVERVCDDCRPRRDLLAAFDAALGEMGKYQNAD